MSAYDLWKDFEIYTDYNGTYASEMYSLEAESIISSHDQSAPLFLYLAAQHIHTPLEADDYLSLFRGVQRDPGVNNYRKQALAMIYALDLVGKLDPSSLQSYS